ncbi:MAG: phosphatase PAP2 family protein [Armatimonadetes bacterium]|nr:phosphatase PAP2 family protein [Armatimonadota bacterium]
MGADVALFRLINSAGATRLGDDLFPWITDAGVLQPLLIAALAGVVIAAYVRRDLDAIRWAWTVVAVAIVSISLCELINKHLIRAYVMRPRPPRTLADVRLLIGLGPSFSFVSSHAHNAAAVCATLARAWPRCAPYVMAFAGVVAYSRVYVGVHYPSDVLAGGLLGILVSGVLWRLAERLRVREAVGVEI